MAQLFIHLQQNPDDPVVFDLKIVVFLPTEISSACQSKYPDDFLGSKIQLEGTILTVPNPQLGIFHYDIEWMTNSNLLVSFDLSDLCTAVITSDSVAFAQLKESRKLYDQKHPDS